MKSKSSFQPLFTTISKLFVLLLFLSSFGNCLQAVRSPFDMINPKSLMQTLVLLLSSTRTLNSYRFSYSGANPVWTSGLCGVADQSTGIGPYTFYTNSGDDVLFTVNSNFQFLAGICDMLRAGELSLYIDGVKRQTSSYNRCWGQYSVMNTSFVVPSMTLGNHTMELKFCSTNGIAPVIDSTNYQNILTATSLQSALNYEGRADFNLPVGTTNLPSSGAYIPIVNGANMAATYTPTNNILLWQGLNLGGIGGAGTVLRLNPTTTEDYFFMDDGSMPANLFSYTPVSAGVATTISAFSQGNANTITTKATYDNTLNLLAFKVPTANTYGKSVFSGSISESVGTVTPVMNIPITNGSSKRYLISFTGNSANGDGTGNGCEFRLFINGSEIVKVPQIQSNGGNATRTSMTTIENLPGGETIPVEIRFNRLLSGTCTVNIATLTVLPLE